MALYRPQRGTLKEAMKEVVEVANLDELKAHLKKEWNMNVEDVKIEYYTYDERIKWDTYLVTVDFLTWRRRGKPVWVPVGFINEKLEA